MSTILRTFQIVIPIYKSPHSLQVLQRLGYHSPNLNEENDSLILPLSLKDICKGKNGNGMDDILVHIITKTLFLCGNRSLVNISFGTHDNQSAYPGNDNRVTYGYASSDSTQYLISSVIPLFYTNPSNIYIATGDKFVFS